MGWYSCYSFFGDDVQLAPVLDALVYLSKGRSPASMHGVLILQEFNTAVVLKKILTLTFMHASGIFKYW